jgi:hypothetical protein
MSSLSTAYDHDNWLSSALSQLITKKIIQCPSQLDIEFNSAVLVLDIID